MYRVVVEGLVAAGKSTWICKNAASLRAHLDAHGIDLVVVPEPVDEWQRLGALEYFYAEPKTRALAFQTLVIVTQLAAIERAVSATTRRHARVVVLTERSPESGRHVFVEMHRAVGNMTRVELAMYERCYDELMARADIGELSAILLYDVTPAVALERTRLRARDGEASVGADYMSALARAYTSALEGPLRRPTLSFDQRTPLAVLVRFIVKGIGCGT